MTNELAKTSSTPLNNAEDWGYDDYSKEQREKDKKSNVLRVDRTLGEGKTIIRIPPPKRGMKSPFRRREEHFILLPGMAIPMIFACPRIHGNKACDFCALGKELSESGNPVMEKIGKDLRSKAQGIANAIDRADNPVEVFILKMPPKKVLQRCLDLLDDEESGGDFLHPVNGFDLVIEKTKKSVPGEIAVDITVTPKRKSTPLAGTQEEMKAIIMGQHDLDEWLKPPSDDEMKSMLAQVKAILSKPIDPSKVKSFDERMAEKASQQIEDKTEEKPTTRITKALPGQTKENTKPARRTIDAADAGPMGAAALQTPGKKRTRTAEDIANEQAEEVPDFMRNPGERSGTLDYDDE